MAKPPGTEDRKGAGGGVLAPLFGRRGGRGDSGAALAQRLSEALRASPLAAVGLDADGAVVFENDAARDLLAGGGLAELIGADALEARRACEVSAPRDGGHTLRIKATPAAFDGGGVLWTLDDVTERHAMGVVDRAERDAISAICNALPGAVCVIDAEDRIVFVNAPFAAAAGLDARAVAAARPDLAHVLERDGDGAARWTASGAAASAVEGGSVGLGDGGVGRVLLVSDPRAADGGDSDPVLTLSDAAGRLRGLFPEAPVGIALLGVGGEVREANPAFVRLLGLEAAQALADRPFVDLIAAEDRDDIAAQLSKMVMGAARGGRFEVRFPKADGSDVRAQLYASRFLDADGDAAGLIVHAIDTTEHRALEVQFAQSQKMQAIGQLAGGVAHDFNNLLTAMIGFTDLLLQRHGPSDPSYADLMQIKQNANRATNLVRQLLAFSRKQTLAPEILDPAEALNDLSNLLTRLLGENVKLNMIPRRRRRADPRRPRPARSGDREPVRQRARCHARRRNADRHAPPGPAAAHDPRGRRPFPLAPMW
jgi:two-component system cell cycle sensor histidine kinase/response regulator CckA